MKDFIIGVWLIIVGSIFSSVVKFAALGNTWMILPIAIILIGGGFQIKAFVMAKRDMNELDRKFKNLNLP